MPKTLYFTDNDDHVLVATDANGTNSIRYPKNMFTLEKQGEYLMIRNIASGTVSKRFSWQEVLSHPGANASQVEGQIGPFFFRDPSADVPVYTKWNLYAPITHQSFTDGAGNPYIEWTGTQILAKIYGIGRQYWQGSPVPLFAGINVWRAAGAGDGVRIELTNQAGTANYGTTLYQTSGSETNIANPSFPIPDWPVADEPIYVRGVADAGDTGRISALMIMHLQTKIFDEP